MSNILENAQIKKKEERNGCVECVRLSLSHLLGF